MARVREFDGDFLAVDWLLKIYARFGDNEIIPVIELAVAEKYADIG